MFVNISLSKGSYEMDEILSTVIRHYPAKCTSCILTETTDFKEARNSYLRLHVYVDKR